MKQIFVPLTKVDAEQRLVYGVAAVEQLDKSNEIFDYAGSKPLFEEWSAGVAKVTNGLSYGNVREMHKTIAAGKLTTPLGFDDVNKTIEVCAKVVDDQAWAKVVEGVYTGFSIGGEYGTVMPDPINKTAKRYTAKPSEISLVDNPCMPGATFQFIKSGAATELRKFTSVELSAGDIPGALYKVCESLAKADDPSVHNRAARVIKRATELKVDASGFAEAYVKLHGGAFGKAALRKGMYDVQDLASIICSLNYTRQYLLSEAEWEGDGSEIPARLKTMVEMLSAILVDLVSEETSELTAAKAASNQLGKEITNVKKFFMSHGATIAKLAASSDPEVVKMVSDLNGIGSKVEELSKSHTALGEQLAKLDIGGAPAAAAPPVPAIVPPASGEPAAPLGKAAEDRFGKIELAQAETNSQIGNLTKALTDFIGSQPAPGRVAVNPQAVAKTADNGAPAAPAIDPKDPEAAFKVMKGIHENPTLIK